MLIRILRVIVLLLTCCAELTVKAQFVPGVMAAASPLATVLTPAGTLRPGASGAFDPRVYHLSSDSAGQPAFRPAAHGDDGWQEGFGVPGTNGSVIAMAVADNGDVYIGGHFSIVGATLARGVARWDGKKWQPLERVMHS